MVKSTTLLVAAIVGAEAAQPVWFRLTPEDRVRVLFALAIILFLGFAFAAFAWWAGRWTRRYMNRPIRSSHLRELQADDWARKPLLPREEEAPEESED